MRILGVRTAPSQFRYAHVESVNGNCSLLNASSENLISIPVHLTDIDKQLQWVKDELDRVIRQNSGLDVIALKTAEIRGSRTKIARIGDYLDAMVLLAAAESGIPIICKQYNQMSTTRENVLTHAQQRVNRTSVGWTVQMADAVAVAWTARK